MLQKEDIEKERTPRGLRQYVLNRIRHARGDRNERHKAFLNQGLYRYFNNEIVPLSRFCLLHFRKGVFIKPILGNQGYDAEFFDNQHKHLGYIEITNPHDGASAHENGKLLVTRGFGNVDVYAQGADLTRMFSTIFETCNKKSQKDYSDCILVISIKFNTPRKEQRRLYLQHIFSLQKRLRSLSFHAREVYLLINAFNRLFPVKQ